ncbi:MAG: inositol monophosphatase [Holosporaceae bacterium]|jgi:myo-inositol-1(or 4)-monophosphatase|nr:inositol monophosphatase [Holosporaceae bacterium]
MISVKLPVQSSIITVMTRAAIKASKGLLRDFSELEHLQVSVKSNKNFVTSADLKADEIIKSELLRARPTYSLLSEESEEIIGEDPSHRWIVDPLDGTTNYMHGFPHWAISLALEKNDEIVAAVTYDPVKNEMFWAEKGCGAYLNDKKIRVSGRCSMLDALISFGILEECISLGEVATSPKIRKTGSTTLNMAYLAAGRLDVLYSTANSNKWDIAAGILLIKEAGGVLADRHGNSTSEYKEVAIMTNVNLLTPAVLYMQSFEK